MHFFILSLFFLLTACDISVSYSQKEKDLDKVTRMNIGGVVLEIPQAYILPDLPSSIVSRSAGMDEESSGALIRVPLSYLGVETETDEWPNTLSAHIYDARIVSPLGASHITDAWKAQGSYKNRVVEFDDEAQLWRVYRSSAGKWAWLFFDRHPEEIKSNPKKHLVVNCRGSSKSPGFLGDARCKDKHVFYRGLTSDISFSGKHVVDRSKLRKAYLKMLESWDKTTEK